MALIECPECKKRISSLAEACPNCGLPKSYFTKVEQKDEEIALENFYNILQSFEFDYNNVFSQNEYIANSAKKRIFDRYYKYFNKFIGDKNLFDRIKNEYADMRIDCNSLISFAEKMKKLDVTIDEYNESFVVKTINDNKEYLDNILIDIDPNIKLDEEQRRAVVTDDDYCLLTAGAGAGKTTTMAAKVKWLVEKKHINPEEIMLISYTNKAIDELKERVNEKLKIPAKISTFHSFAFDIVKNSVDRRPEVNFTSYKIISEMLEKRLFTNNSFMRKTILFLGYYFNVPEEAFDFKDLDEYHLYKSSQEYNTLKGDLEKYIEDVQDIATQRFNFTKKLSEVTGAKVVAVGDDWQSIYAFAGSDISLFTRFLELLGSGKELQITHTYRNSQELIDIAGNFIQKNSMQIKKQLISPKHLEEPIKIESFDDKYQVFNNLAERTTEMIGEIINEYGIESSILLIGRYNFDKNKLTRTEYFDEVISEKGKSREKIICNKYPNANITFMTAHSSKGLGYDNVILINMLEGKFGFPSQIAIDPIMRLVVHEDTKISSAEERRLLYVALTRTKNRVFIVAPQVRPSRFLIELIKDYNLKYDGKINTDIVKLYSKRCPKCGFPLKKEFNGRLGLLLWICSNEPEVCDFMTNSEVILKDIFKCQICDGYMVVKKKKDKEYYFYGCTNYDSGRGCLNVLNFDEVQD